MAMGQCVGWMKETTGQCRHDGIKAKESILIGALAII